MALNARQVETAKGSRKLQKLSDGGGLQLWITEGSSKLWRLACRYGGKQKLLALGSYLVTRASRMHEPNGTRRRR
ncbi:MAG: Arm DNA-binding domain-containing protein, partial [Candidatus Devosia symbiotica]|nr:Arm DNA-binding domain-containing protein [Candidatus Devosia symbiotica]